LDFVGLLLLYGSSEAAEWLESSYTEIQDADGRNYFNAKIVITRPRIVRFCSNLVQSLTSWQPIHYNRSVSKGQDHSVT